MQTANALVFDRHPLIRDTLRYLLEERSFTVYETDCERELIRRASEKKPTIITVDITSPVSAIEILISQLKAVAPQSKVLVITSLPTEHYSSCCIRAGASGLVSKKVKMVCLNAAIDAVIHDYLFFPVRDLLVISEGAWSFNREKPNSLDGLTKREKYVLYKVLQGKSLTHMAEDLGVSVKTVSTYKSRILKKWG
ncbi:putative two-component response regulator [Yersinia frederiksenii]|uniref:Bacterial regulatory s, luxR family protein n=2 Tax=Yersinia frederiksenii TaxID=29484 RepID=A0ABR4VWE8_YERFR|nr:response regulator transcription factor [Yersinia frederiksenii]ATM95536.1 DNA-binding response regulator [Yersinia frederiksenii]EEQ12629.1 Response regulator containing a CheY-like receiver domain and an HTH DNA-binding domain [Yersinia frederiksenii ATCC 33641]KGA43634.1 bacterial regulatory s, luxR family protein [Yersinia frederiksenii ATCC 33641]CFR15589.1 putative two-component response regulator [Yersinia frederiksenii]SUP75858.1 putative two-component response regulator [Yersinia f